MSALIYYFLLILGVLTAVGLFLKLFVSGGHTDDDPGVAGDGIKEAHDPDWEGRS